MARILVLAIALAVCATRGAFAEPIHEAATRGDAETVLLLLEEGTPVDQFDTTDSYGRPTTALYKATMAGRTEVVELLLNAGADPTLRSPDSRSELHPLQVAAKFGRIEILQMFLDRGADPNAPGKQATALHTALASKKPEIAQLLLDAGAMPSIRQPAIAGQLSRADPQQGREIYISTCQYCHRKPRPDDTPKHHLPSLWGVVGRDVASVDGAIYSDAMKAVDGVWTYDRLNSFIAMPAGFVPATIMEYPPHYTPPDAQGRIALIAYLRMQSDDPVALPSPE